MIEGTTINIMESKRYKVETSCFGNLASIKFRQPVEIDSGKKCAKWKRARRFQHTCTSKQIKKSKLIKNADFMQRTRNIISRKNTTYDES